MEKIELPAKPENLEKLIEFAVEYSRKAGFDDEVLGKIRLACEEALVNVINYAYPGKEGAVAVACDLNADGRLSIELSDAGIPFDPLSLPAPDITLPPEKRKIGGLGIYMIRQIMDQVTYKRENDRNILTMYKNR